MTDNRMKSIYQKRTRIGDNILKVLIYLAAGVAIALLVGIMGYVFVRGLPQVSWQLLSTVQSSLKGTFGILGNIINTIYIIVITLIIAAPIGIGSAIYLNEYAKPGKLVRTIEFTTEILSGIPSIIFGLFGMVFFGMTLKLGYSVLTGSFTLTLMVLPLITRNTPGSTQNRSGQLPQRRTGNRCNEMVYDPDDPAAERGTGYSDRRHPFDWPYRGRVGGASVYCRKRLPASEKPVWKTV